MGGIKNFRNFFGHRAATKQRIPLSRRGPRDLLNFFEYIPKSLLCVPCELCEIHGLSLNRSFRFWAIVILNALG